MVIDIIKVTKNNIKTITRKDLATSSFRIVFYWKMSGASIKQCLLLTFWQQFIDHNHVFIRCIECLNKASLTATFNAFSLDCLKAVCLNKIVWGTMIAFELMKLQYSANMCVKFTHILICNHLIHNI